MSGSRSLKADASQNSKRATSKVSILWKLMEFYNIKDTCPFIEPHSSGNENSSEKSEKLIQVGSTSLKISEDKLSLQSNLFVTSHEGTNRKVPHEHQDNQDRAVLFRSAHQK